MLLGAYLAGVMSCLLLTLADGGVSGPEEAGLVALITILWPAVLALFFWDTWLERVARSRAIKRGRS